MSPRGMLSSYMTLLVPTRQRASEPPHPITVTKDSSDRVPNFRS
jgi:hypothetical protein